MSVYFISDLHLGHKNIMKFAGDFRHGETPEENFQSIVDRWNERITKRDKVFVLGDVAFNDEGWRYFQQLQGRKVLIRGNHDDYKLRFYAKYFDEVFGLYQYRCKGFKAWLSHAPIHPVELRGSINIHGHVHQNHIRNAYGDIDERYVNVCVENTDGAPVPLDAIRDGERLWGKIVK